MSTANKIIRRIINTAKAPKAIGAYNQAVIVDNTMYLSGQIGLLPETGDFVGDDIGEQTHQVLRNIGAVLNAAGASYNNVVKTTILLADINDFQAVNNAYKEYFNCNQPARAAYQCAQLPKQAKVEIEAIAVVGEIEDR